LNHILVRLFISYSSVWLITLHIELDIIFGDAGGHPRHPTETVLTITVSANASSPLTGTVNTTNPPADNLVTEAATGPIVQSTESGTPEPPTAGSQTEVSRTTLLRAEKAIDSINAITTWKRAVHAIKWVMDTVKPIAAVCPIYFLSKSTLT
jgi:hypothetical protein